MDSAREALAAADGALFALAELGQQVEAARAEAKDWEAAALIWQAVVMAPLRPDAFHGRVQ